MIVAVPVEVDFRICEQENHGQQDNGVPFGEDPFDAGNHRQADKPVAEQAENRRCIRTDDLAKLIRRFYRPAKSDGEKIVERYRNDQQRKNSEDCAHKRPLSGSAARGVMSPTLLIPPCDGRA